MDRQTDLFNELGTGMQIFDPVLEVARMNGLTFYTRAEATCMFRDSCEPLYYEKLRRDESKHYKEFWEFLNEKGLVNFTHNMNTYFINKEDRPKFERLVLIGNMTLEED